MSFKILRGDCRDLLHWEVLREVEFSRSIDLTFLDPPFNQSKKYKSHKDNMPENAYWQWMKEIARRIYDITSFGGAIYFMQREKNAEYVLRCLRETGWEFQNLIIWKKMTSAIPSPIRFGKHYQIIAFATKGKKTRTFNKLRIKPPLKPNYKQERKNGIYLTDVWDDIRELTSGYFAGQEPIRDNEGRRFHKQQSPIKLLTRIILSSTKPGDLVLDPFAGTGTTIVVSEQLGRNSIGMELDPENVNIMHQRMSCMRDADNVSGFMEDYHYTKNLDCIWPKIE
ncbi:site-specific DNA-methyltransferase [Candidatus Poribacteria bacterium]|nr:site-specific DNA-methyltransferase [Candidatus Poribacteria bacterium]